MAKKNRLPQLPSEPEISPQQGIVLIRQQIEKGNELLTHRPIPENAYSSWELLTQNFLEKAFGKGSSNVSSVIDVGKYGSFPMNGSASWWDEHRAKSLVEQLSNMNSLVELLTTESELQSTGVVRLKSEIRGHRIFLVHGHDDSALKGTARFLEKLDQEIIILREQPNCGRTIIEKFEQNANVGFAVVLLTGDDRGGTVETLWDEQKPRARQNVIFEMGYFIGRLGRDRVCILYSPGVEIPSDYSGVLYLPLDERGAWRLELAKELKAAGLSIDMNNAL